MGFCESFTTNLLFTPFFALVAPAATVNLNALATPRFTGINFVTDNRRGGFQSRAFYFVCTICLQYRRPAGRPYTSQTTSSFVGATPGGCPDSASTSNFRAGTGACPCISSHDNIVQPA